MNHHSQQHLQPAPLSNHTNIRKSRLRLPHWAATLIVILALAGLIAMFQSDDSAKSRAETVSVNARLESIGTPATPTDTVTEDPEAPIAETTVPKIEPAQTYTETDMLGTWELDDGMIKRVISVNDDGTAKLHVKFDFFTAFRYGSEVDLDLEWTLTDDILSQTIIAGSPEAGRKTLISDFGQSASYQILSLQDGQLHMIETGKNPEEYLWKKIETE